MSLWGQRFGHVFFDPDLNGDTAYRFFIQGSGTKHKLGLAISPKEEWASTRFSMKQVFVYL